ncbi:MAG: isoprenylcysteine carboxylmethyltransferase family protein [Deltaproteobacteria bacterium]|nr:isoprenylcysteine carboxylmethyltransferase family protein [Deltaproteobacteria bacterium]
MAEENQGAGATAPARSLPRTALQIAFTVAIFIGFLFGLAGRWDWWEAWAYLGCYAGLVAAFMLWAWRHHPGLLTERMHSAHKAKRWDRVLMSIYTVFFVALFGVAALDTRWSWSAVPGWAMAAAAVALLLVSPLLLWVTSSNAFLSSYVRIQNDRGQRVVTDGPYRFVRHPMYAVILVFFWATPLWLGSWFALIPSLAITVIFVIRTALEDRTLQADLPGYREYAAQVRFRLLPGIW